MRFKLLGLSRYSQMSTMRPVKGITAIRPAKVGSLRPICEHKVIIHMLINSLITNRISIDAPTIAGKANSYFSV